LKNKVKLKNIKQLTTLEKGRIRTKRQKENRGKFTLTRIRALKVIPKDPQGFSGYSWL